MMMMTLMWDVLNKFSFIYANIIKLCVIITSKVRSFEIYSSSSSLKRYVLQYTRLNSANTSGNVIRDITSILFDLEHCLLLQNEWGEKRKCIEREEVSYGLLIDKITWGNGCKVPLMFCNCFSDTCFCFDCDAINTS